MAITGEMDDFLGCDRYVSELSAQMFTTSLSNTGRKGVARWDTAEFQRVLPRRPLVDPIPDAEVILVMTPSATTASADAGKSRPRFTERAHQDILKEISYLCDILPVENNKFETVKNSTLLKGFYLNTFNISNNVKLVVVIGVLLIYLLAVLGNVTIVTLVSLVSQLQTPMYLFLCSLSVQDIMYVSATLPKLLAITITDDTNITFSGCITQIFLYVFCVDTEFFLLTSMAYDRYVAICTPLHYPLIMSKTVCALLITVSWFGGFLNAYALSLIVSHLTFCNKQDINNFFCDVIILLRLSCSDITFIINFFVLLEGTVLGLLPFTFIMVSYIYIISTIVKIRSSSGRLKTFSSCSSHLTVVVLFYGTSISLNMKPKSENSLEIDKLLSIIYIGVVPMVNPLVYSLRNKEVFKAVKYFFNQN
ncbi:olfactory receptor 2K2-like [Bombina bombina]|uniref:olfactory receptor 2K2-like n=1 Tax=Bombina bombina TaxID=8345 RepID=UPI00235B0B2C|nr:olfactory receptor 2K2-like [Bombina bombina]